MTGPAFDPPASNEEMFGAPVSGVPHSISSSQPFPEFKPWHLPRKQLVRKEQWAASLKALVGEHPRTGPIRYVGLPGQDLLDLQLLAEVSRDVSRPFQYLAFDDDPTSPVGDRLPRDVASNIVHGIGTIVENSRIVRHKFSDIAVAESASQRAFREMGDIDIVNLDLCNAFTSGGVDGHMHNALAALLQQQKNTRTFPWVLCLTLRGEVSRMVPTEVSTYIDVLNSNCQSSQRFRERLCGLARVPLGNPVTGEALVTAMRSSSWVSGQMTGIALGKWMAHLLASSTPWKVSIVSLWGYRTGLLPGKGDQRSQQRADGPPNMISLVYQFDRKEETVFDERMLAPAFSPRAQNILHDPFREQAIAEGMVNAVGSEATDLDARLAGDEDLFSSLLSEAKDALEVRMYDGAGYEAFVSGAAKVRLVGAR
jgi:hypothetical protein